MGYIIGLIAFSFFFLSDYNLRRMKGERPELRSSAAVTLLVVGTVVMSICLLQYLFPGGTLTAQTVFAALFAVLMIYVLFSCRTSYLILAASKRLVPIALTILAFCGVVHLTAPLQALARTYLGLTPPASTLAAAVYYFTVLVLCGLLMHRHLNVVFTHEEAQNKLVKDFTTDVSQSLSTTDIMEKLCGAISSELPTDQVFICLLEKDSYVGRYCSDPQGAIQFSIPGNSPHVSYLKEKCQPLFNSKFRNTPQFLFTDDAEKALLENRNIDCMTALWDEDQVVGLVLISFREHSFKLNGAQTRFLETLNSISSIAMKNATLYEQMFQEARIDTLTGAYNYRFFVEQLDAEFTLFGKECLTLLYIDVDDFKLYNQLYGANEGDIALCRISKAISRCVGEAGSVFRTSGKVFAVLLPQMDPHHANILAQDIQAQIQAINMIPERNHLKPLTASIGISSAPHCATNPKVLMSNTDLATYSAKQAGKNRIMTFRNRTAGLVSPQLVERTVSIVENVERGDSEYRTALPMISALTAAIDAKDHYTYAHSKNVARYAATLAVAAGLSEDEVRMIYTAGLLHDIGKISISETILNKRGHLEEEEYLQMQGHVNNSIDMIRHLPEMDFLVPGVLGHHERWDGTGYPCGLKGEELPISARCLAVADAFDAMTTNRCYRKSLPLEYALEEIQRAAGSQLDPQLAPLFVKLVRNRSIPVFNVSCS